jgi:hypothetical protein
VVLTARRPHDLDRTPWPPGASARYTPDEALEPEQFDEMVAALVKVDPEGITGQRSAKKKDDGEND